MAKSPSHKLGQIIGETLEAALHPLLQEFCQTHRLYLDTKGERPARPGKKLTWTDHNNNSHDLDFVIEKGGTDETLGRPVAFIESAWRRYTKHSRNKAQEIQGAVLPLVATYPHEAPFYGAFLGGMFTGASLEQLESLGFKVVYFSYSSIVEAFRTVGMDVAFDEDTPESHFLTQVQYWAQLTKTRKNQVEKALINRECDQVKAFMSALTASVTRCITLIRVLPLHGAHSEWHSVAEAIQFVSSYQAGTSPLPPFVRFEVVLRYSNGDKIDAVFQDKSDLIAFLHQHQSPATETPIPQ